MSNASQRTQKPRRPAGKTRIISAPLLCLVTLALCGLGCSPDQSPIQAKNPTSPALDTLPLPNPPAPKPGEGGNLNTPEQSPGGSKQPAVDPPKARLFPWGDDRPHMVLLDFDGPKPPVNAGGDLYPSFYGGAGAGDISINSKDAVSGNSLQATLTKGYAQIQFNPYNGSKRSFARDLCKEPKKWQFNTYNRFGFWIKMPSNDDSLSTKGMLKYQFGTFVKRVKDADPQSDELGGNHYYHLLNLGYTGTWNYVILNSHPSHVRSGTKDPGSLPHPTNEPDYNYFDAVAKPDPPKPYPCTYMLDDFVFYKEPFAENDDKVYSIAGTYVPDKNRLVVTWSRPKPDNDINHEVRYAFDNIHKVGWDKAIAAPDGIRKPPGWYGYNGMFYDTTALPLKGKNLVYVAIKPEGATLFSQIAIPLNMKKSD